MAFIIQKKQSLIHQNIVTQQQMKELEDRFHPMDILTAMCCSPTTLQGLTSACEHAELY